MRKAQSDIAEIFDYIAAQDSNVALAVEAEIMTACYRLGDFPYANPATQRKNVFRMPIRRRGFAVFYRVKPRAKVVEIVRVVRGRRLRDLRQVPQR